MTRVRGWLADGARGLVWYLREASGETAYERYVAHELVVHPGRPVLDRRTFERRRQDDRTVHARCC
ncbi:hypothetical protein GCM10023340_41890 [Nocardioides marinquilinus]|uniref:YbdD/YjiX family protein n=1 Tax=Nocardioides marinquilinus TaxID=1210400 RepID=A0ABP9Q2K7_9ACTN